MKLVTVKPNFLTRKKGRALVSYLKDPSKSVHTQDILPGHTNRWESREIVRTMVSLGYITDVINWDDTSFMPTKKYNVIIDIADLFNRWQDFLSEDTIKILHLTGSYPVYQNKAEQKVAKEFEHRTKIAYTLKRQIDNTGGHVEALKLASSATLLGNAHTLQTYPTELQSKITLLPVTASYLQFKKQGSYVPNKKHFLWYFGSGAIHKGLDKVVEVFLKRKDVVLHIIGNIDDDHSFWKAYRSKIAHSKNIFYHGFLQPDDSRFKHIIEDIFCFIAPSCSESMSTAVATCLCLGLYPILSRDTGITLPDNYGIYLKSVTIPQIDAAVNSIVRYTSDRISNEIEIIQKDAIHKYSRKEFSKNIRNFLESHIL